MSTIRIAKYEFNMQDDVFFNNIALVLYAQGCLWKCKGCHSKSLWSMSGGQLLTFKQLCNIIENADVNIKDLTLVGQGGDFWFQRERWRDLCFAIKDKYPNIKIAWQTGATRQLVKSFLGNNIYPFDVVACEKPFYETYKTVNKKYLIWSNGKEEWKILQ